LEALKLVDQKAGCVSMSLKDEYLKHQKVQSSLQNIILDGSHSEIEITPYNSNVQFELTVTHHDITPLLETITISGTYYVITKDGDFKIPHTGYVTLILIGGGASGGQGGSGPHQFHIKNMK
jgi:hypothetical protein